MADAAISEERKPRTFTIGEKDYEIPDVFGLDFDEAQILYDQSRFTVEDFVADGDDGTWTDEGLLELIEKMKNPAFLRALRHIAFRRSNPTLSEPKIKVAVAKDNFAERYIEWVTALDEEEDASPPAEESTSPPEEPLNSKTDLRLASSGSDDSEPTLIGPATPLATTGAGS